jgi:hypothetical protein
MLDASGNQPQRRNTNLTDLQILTLGLSIIIPLSMLIYSNSRISDSKERLRAEIATMRTEMKGGFEQTAALLNP